MAERRPTDRQGQPAAQPGQPTVSIGIPTYNRAEQLARAAESVLAQTHDNLALTISDNASSDGTEAYCRALCERDSRVRYLRSPVNRGPTANFNVLFGALDGDYAMVLSDDDWLERDYVASCLQALRADRGLALVCGRARYLRDGEVVRTGVDLQLLDDSPVKRVLGYLRDVDENGVFYGLMEREVLRRATPLRNVLGNDWLVVAAVAMQGKVATIGATSLNRELDGTSADFSKLTATLGLPSWQAWVPHFAIAWQVLADVAWRVQVYQRLSPPSRAALALAGAWRAIRWRSLVWHMTMPVFAALGRRRGGRWLWRCYLRLARAAGSASAASPQA